MSRRALVLVGLLALLATTFAAPAKADPHGSTKEVPESDIPRSKTPSPPAPPAIAPTFAQLLQPLWTHVTKQRASSASSLGGASGAASGSSSSLEIATGDAIDVQLVPQGATALREVKAGTRLLSIPRSHCLTVESVKASALGGALAKAEITEPRLLLTFYFMQQREVAASPFRAYFDTLPRPPAPYLGRYLPRRERTLFRALVADDARIDGWGTEGGKLYESVARPFFAANGDQFSGISVTHEEFLWAYDIICSRVIRVGDETVLIPFMDAVRRQARPNAEVRLRKSRASSGGVGVPVDESKEEGVDLFELSVDETVAAGAQITIAPYNSTRVTVADLMITYGMAPVGNYTFDTLPLPVNWPSNDPNSFQKQSIIARVYGQVYTKFTLQRDIKPESLLLHMRVFFMTPEEFSQHGRALLGDPISARNEAEALGALVKQLDQLLERLKIIETDLKNVTGEASVTMKAIRHQIQLYIDSQRAIIDDVRSHISTLLRQAKAGMIQTSQNKRVRLEPQAVLNHTIGAKTLILGDGISSVRSTKDTNTGAAGSVVVLSKELPDGPKVENLGVPPMFSQGGNPTGPQPFGNPRVLERIKASAGEGTIPYLQHIEDDFFLYVITSPLGDISVASYLEKHPALDLASALAATKALASGLARMHAAHVALANLTLDALVIDSHAGPGAPRGGSVRMVDFSCSKTTGADGSVTGEIAGVDKAPEQARAATGAALNGPAIDMWRLGLAVYRMLEGRSAFVDDKHAQTGDYSVPRHTGSFPADVIALINGLFAVDPAERFTAAQVLEHPALRAAAMKEEL